MCWSKLEMSNPKEWHRKNQWWWWIFISTYCWSRMLIKFSLQWIVQKGQLPAPSGFCRQPDPNRPKNARSKQNSIIRYYINNISASTTVILYDKCGQSSYLEAIIKKHSHDFNNTLGPHKPVRGLCIRVFVSSRQAAKLRNYSKLWNMLKISSFELIGCNVIINIYGTIPWVTT